MENNVYCVKYSKDDKTNVDDLEEQFYFVNKSRLLNTQKNQLIVNQNDSEFIPQMPRTWPKTHQTFSLENYLKRELRST